MLTLRGTPEKITRHTSVLWHPGGESRIRTFASLQHRRLVDTRGGKGGMCPPGDWLPPPASVGSHYLPPTAAAGHAAAHKLCALVSVSTSHPCPPERCPTVTDPHDSSASLVIFGVLFLKARTRYVMHLRDSQLSFCKKST